MRSTLYLIALASLLSACLGPAPWADWETSYRDAPSAPMASSPGGGWASGEVAVAPAEAPLAAPSEEVRYGKRPEIETLAAEPITAPPVTRAAGGPPTAIGGPYIPLSDESETQARDSGAYQPLARRGAASLRTLPLVMTGTGKKAP